MRSHSTPQMHPFLNPKPLLGRQLSVPAVWPLEPPAQSPRWPPSHDISRGRFFTPRSLSQGSPVASYPASKQHPGGWLFRAFASCLPAVCMPHRTDVRAGGGMGRVQDDLPAGPHPSPSAWGLRLALRGPGRQPRWGKPRRQARGAALSSGP